MKPKNELTIMSLKIPKETHKKLKVAAALVGESMTNIILAALESWQDCLESLHIPNKETLKSIKNIEEGKNLFEAKDIKDLFKKAGIC